MQKVKRTIPYITKNQWQLTLPPTYEELKARTNAPKNWRRLESLEPWKKQMFALKEKFPEGWNPQRKLTREKMDELRERRALDPSLDNTQLGNIYRISPEAVRRILKSTWTPPKPTKPAKSTKPSTPYTSAKKFNKSSYKSPYRPVKENEGKDSI